MANTDMGNAKRATRATLELAKLLSDGEWYNTTYLALAAGKYIPPERVWRRAWQHRQKTTWTQGGTIGYLKSSDTGGRLAK